MQITSLKVDRGYFAIFIGGLCYFEQIRRMDCFLGSLTDNMIRNTHNYIRVKAVT